MAKINNHDFVKAVAEKTEYTQKNISEIVDAMEEVAIEMVGKGDSVKVFKTVSFEPVTRAERTGRNPQTGEAITIPAKKSVKAKFGKVFKDAISE